MRDKRKIAEIIFLPLKLRMGEYTMLIILSFIIGILAGLTNILFRSTMDIAHGIIFIEGSQLLHIRKAACSGSFCHFCLCWASYCSFHFRYCFRER